MAHLALSSPIDHDEGWIAVARRFGAGVVAASLGAIVVLWILGAHYDRFWWPVDEGAYAHVAQMLLRGGVLHRDMQDIHAGYVNFANAAAFRAFGEDLLSLRYPLVAMGLVQALLAFLMFRQRGPWTAALAAVALTALSTVQFLNPTAHWYGLFLAILTTAALAGLPAGTRGRVELVGFLIITAFLFRQLTGVFIAMGAIAFLLGERPIHRAVRPRLARALAGLMMLGVAGYLGATMQPTNLVLFGVGPLAVLAMVYRTTGLGDRAAVAMVRRLAIGGALAALPLLTYLAVNGAVFAWFDDTVLAAMSQTGLAFIANPYHLWILIESARGLIQFGGPAVALNGLFWIALLLLPLVNGALLVRALAREDEEAAHPLPFMAVFYAMVSVHHQIPIYLWFTAGLSALGFLWLAGARDGRWLALPRLAVAGAVAIALWCHAAQPVTRGLLATIHGDRAAGLPTTGVAHANLRIEADDAARYATLLDLIARESRPGETILALPNNPELYFLGDRPSAVRFFNAAFGLRSEQDAQALIETMRRSPPALVFHDPQDKYNTSHGDRVMAFVRQDYEHLGRQGELDVYRRPARP